MESIAPVIFECMDGVVPEIPEDVGALAESAQAATEDIIKILVSHNPRLRPRYDRFDVVVAFRPCSDVDFDPGEFRSTRQMCHDGFRCDWANAFNFAQSSGSASISSGILSRLQSSASTMPSSKSECSFRDLKRFSDTNTNTRTPKQRLIARLLGCLGRSRTTDY